MQDLGKSFKSFYTGLPFATEEATLLSLVPLFGYVTPKNGNFQYALPMTGERVIGSIAAR